MKAKLYSIAFAAFCLIASTIQAQDNFNLKSEAKFKKQKSYSKSYNISSSDKISLENQFGELKLVKWDKNEVKVDVSITAKSDEESRAQKILDRISIKDEKSNNGVSFKTVLAKSDKEDSNDDNKNKHSNEGMEINYTVYLPTANPLYAKNQFGSMIVPDYRGEATLESAFGSLTAGKISNAKSVTVKFGKTTIDEINNGTLEIQYSTGEVKNLTGDVDAKLQFSTVKLGIDKDVKNLDANATYSEVYLDLDKNLSASYNISTSLGSFVNKSNFTINSQSGGNNRGSQTYSGTSGNGSSKIKVHSSFGSVTVGHNLQVDLSKKKKTVRS